MSQSSVCPADLGPKGDITFTRNGLKSGAVKVLPLALGVVAYGLVFGMLAKQAGLSTFEALLMSATVYAGASQFVVLDMWLQPLPIAGIIITTLIVNLRHVLMGAALAPWFGRISPGRAYFSVFFMVDEGWALTLGEFGKGTRDCAFLLGTGLCIYFCWFAATWAGLTLGSMIDDPARFGLDFAFVAAFIALMTGMFRGRSDIVPWFVAACLAVAASYLLPGKWYILIGGLGGSLAGACLDGDA